MRVLTLLIAGLASIVSLFACSTEPASTPSATSIPEPTPTTDLPSPTPTPVPTPTPDPGPAPTETVPDSVAVESLVMLEDPLDEPEFYCVDVAGFGANLNVNSPLQAHTCKPGADDEMFAFNRPSARGRLYLVEHDRCLEADGMSVYVRSCSESPLQRFAYGQDKTFRLESEDLCLTVASGNGQPAGGRSHLRRDLLLAPCADVEPNLSRWVFPGSSPNQ